MGTDNAFVVDDVVVVVGGIVVAEECSKGKDRTARQERRRQNG